jgi:serine/threonine protein phosphatase 1
MPSAPPVIYAIGDVHGRRDLLERLLSAIEHDATRHEAPWRIVFLGDIIDRGPESRQTLDLVIRTLHDVPGSRLILGNHEEFLLRFLDQRKERRQIGKVWLRNGGKETLASYGIDLRTSLDKIAARFAEEFPAHVEALRAAEWRVETDRYFLVHGGIDPQVGLDRQEPERTRWIRHEFLDFAGPLPKVVVHGHTPTHSFMPEVHANRIGLDTGAVFSGHLTCAILDEGGAPPRFLATDDHGPTIEVAEVHPVTFASSPPHMALR